MAGEAETQAVTSPVQAAGVGSEQATAVQAAAGAGGAQGDDGEALSLEEAKKLRREAQGLRKRLVDYEDREKAAQAAALSDSEKLQKRVKELEAQTTAAAESHRRAMIRYEVMLQAQGLGVVDPDAAVRLMDDGALEFDEAGQPTNVEKVLKELLKAKPYLVKQAAQQAPNINAGDRGNAGADAKAKEEELRRRFRL